MSAVYSTDSTAAAYVNFEVTRVLYVATLVSYAPERYFYVAETSIECGTLYAGKQQQQKKYYYGNIL